MNLPPVLAALLRNKTGLVLIALQIALTLAIVSNAVYLIAERLGQMSRPSGIDEDHLFTVTSLPFAANYDARNAQLMDLDALRAMPGVVDAVAINTGLPLSGGGWSEGLSKQPQVEGKRSADYTMVGLYNVDEHGLDTLGVELVEGRNFTEQEVGWFDPLKLEYPSHVILSEAAARRLFPDGGAVGQPVYFGVPKPVTVIGVVRRLQSPWVNSERHENTLLMPVRMAGETKYLIRTEPGQRDRVMGEVEALLLKVNDGRIVRGLMDYGDIRAKGYRRQKVTAVTLVVMVVALLAVTALGIVGMTSFWVTKRTKQIGTRRALGARRRDVLRYFQSENLYIAGAGVAVGALLAFALNAFLMQRFDVPRLEWFYVPVGAVLLLGLGQLAVLGPALRASSVSPSVATRSV